MCSFVVGLNKLLAKQSSCRFEKTWHSCVVIVVITLSASTHCGLTTPYGDIGLGQHVLKQWLVAWRHQSNTWTNVDQSSVRFWGIHLRAVTLGVWKLLFCRTNLKILLLKLLPHLPGSNELICMLYLATPLSVNSRSCYISNATV